jgi:hypothetical protein
VLLCADVLWLFMKIGMLALDGIELVDLSGAWQPLSEDSSFQHGSSSFWLFECDRFE